ncbi:MAG: flagellar basal-body rod protein FlgG [Alphaproteobacteria bacterium]|nr:MAG: flagellar basal-body rod protein FlgG [Alphaproteobacteria bacterium]
MRALSIAATGMLAQQTNVEVISNNIANLNTTGFKRSRAEFQDLLYQSMRRVGASTGGGGEVVPTGVQVGLGVQTAAVYRIHDQGTLQSTGNPYDLAIKGKGFFQVLLPNGETAYTREGAFTLNASGQLVTQDGYQVQPSITIPSDAVDVAISEDGAVLVKQDGQTALSNVGQLDLATFPNESGLAAHGNNLYLETESSGAPVTGQANTTGFGSIQQNYLEASNVNIVSEITTLITAQRAYEMNSKVIETGDQMMGTISQMR